MSEEKKKPWEQPWTDINKWREPKKAETRNDLPPKQDTPHFGASKLPREVKRLLQVMMPTVPLEQMSITAGPEEIRHNKDKIEAYRHNGIDAQAVSVEEGQPQFKNWAGDTKSQGRGEPVFAPIGGKGSPF